MQKILAQHAPLEKQVFGWSWSDFNVPTILRKDERLIHVENLPSVRPSQSHHNWLLMQISALQLSYSSWSAFERKIHRFKKLLSGINERESTCFK